MRMTRRSVLEACNWPGSTPGIRVCSESPSGASGGRQPAVFSPSSGPPDSGLTPAACLSEQAVITPARKLFRLSSLTSPIRAAGERDRRDLLARRGHRSRDRPTMGARDRWAIPPDTSRRRAGPRDQRDHQGRSRG
jgi:hypothetical protein